MQQCLTSVRWLVLEHVPRGGGGETSNISLLFGHVLLSQKIVLNDIFAKLMNQRQKELIFIVVGYPQVFGELNYPLSDNLFIVFDVLL